MVDTAKVMECLFRDEVTKSECVCRKEGRMNRAVKLFYTKLQWWIHVITHFSKPIESITPRLTPKLWSLVNNNVSMWANQL